MPCDSPFYVLPKAGTEKVPVPCGRCPSCKLRRVNGWVFRLLEEDKVSSSSHFVTLTYDTEFVPISENGFMTLRKKDLQDFFKRLRKLCHGSKIRYYAVGEYGTKNRRPHYHGIFFNVPDASLFTQAWSLGGRPLGAVHIGTVAGESCAYVMKYMDKPRHKAQFARDDREPEFPLMSKGLGASYLSDAVVRYHQSDISRLFLTREGGHRVAMPRYYRQKIYSEQDQRRQVHLIKSVADDRLRIDEIEFKRMYGDSMNFFDYQESKKYGRYKSFYKNQIDRDV